MVTAGFVVVLFIAYQLWVTDLFQARTQDRLREELNRVWAAAPSANLTPAPGQEGASRPPEAGLGSGIAVLRIPRFGAGYAPVVVEGVAAEDLKLGPGHYPGTAMPGAVGNFVVSGHRTTHGRPFGRVDELVAGDPIVVEVRDSYFTYRVTGSKVVSPDRVDVVLPVPEKPGAVPTKSLLTFTTCHPKYSAASRLIVFAELAGATAKSDGPPAALAGR